MVTLNPAARAKRTLCLCAFVPLSLSCVLASAAEPAKPPAFTKKPAATKAGDKVVISFAVDRETDVAVYVEAAKGKVVRHLAAGVLGKNPPDPLKANSLEQSVEWDGKDDDGRPAAGGPFKVRVGLRLKVDYAGTAFTEKSGPNSLTGIAGMAAGPDGRVYVIDDRPGFQANNHFNGSAVHVFRRDGSYERTIKPFSPSLGLERLRGSGAFTNDHGFMNPLIRHQQDMGYYPASDWPAVQMVVADGRLWHTVVNVGPGAWSRGFSPRIAAVDLEGGMPIEPFAGPVLGDAKAGWKYAQPYMAASSDGKSLYLTGFGAPAGGSKTADVLPFVARVKLPERGPGEVVFGDLKQAGDDNAHLKQPRGLAADGQGHLLVCDYGNNRVVVLDEKDMSFAGAFPAEAPEWVGCHPKTGAVFVCEKNDVVKYSNWKDHKELYRVSLGFQKKGGYGAYEWKFRRSLALDAAAEKPVLWLGLNMTPSLLRCEDLGDRFSDPAPADCYFPPSLRNPTTDPYRREVGCQVGNVLNIMDEETGKVRKINRVIDAGGINRLGPDGCIYSNTHALGIRRWDRDGKLKPFEATDVPTGPYMGGLPNKAGSSGTTAWERDYFIDRRNDIYAKMRGGVYHGLMHVAVFGQDGRMKRTALWGVTDGAYGPKLDPKGNMYVMEAVKPVGETYPAEFKTQLPNDKGIQRAFDYMYGSIVKFGPAGGNIMLTGKETDKPTGEKVALPVSALTMKVEGTAARRKDGAIQGAFWIAPGFSPVGDMVSNGGSSDSCHCTGTDFDVDDFGRTFAPDLARHRITVLDTGGNVLLSFGAYGNQDCCGPDSYVVDPATRLLRPRKADDPKELASPFAEPAIAFNWIIGLAVTDRHAYVADLLNARVLRCKLGYATTETAVVP